MSDDDALIDIKEIAIMMDASKSTAYRASIRSDFPRSYLIGERIVRWYRRDVRNWINNRPRRRS